MPENFKNFIAGEWVAPRTGAYFENRNPADWEDVIGCFPRSGPDDVTRAVASAKRGFEIGLVSEVVPAAELHDAAAWAGDAIASAPPLAIQGTLRAIWTGLELSRTQALEQAYGYIAMGTNQDSIAEGQKTFSSGKRIEWRLR